MLLWVLNIFYVLIAIAMIALILMQRGAGAQAGSGFGGGASGTVFGARGAANFLSKSTKWLAVAFFGITLGMAWMHLSGTRKGQAENTDLGVMGGAPAATAPARPAAPVIPQAAPAPAAQGVPAAPTQNVPTVPTQNVPAAPAQDVPQVRKPAQ